MRHDSQRFAREVFDFEGSMEVLSIGMALMAAQNVVVANPFFSEAEIRKYLKARMEFHPMFSEACLMAAEGFKGTPLEAVVKPLERISRLSPRQTQQGLVQLVRAFRVLQRIKPVDVGDRRVFRLLWTLRKLVLLVDEGEREDYFNAQMEFRELFDLVIRLPHTSPKIKTLFRKMLKVPVPANTLSVEANPGAWFHMPPDEKVAVRTRLQDLTAQQTAAYDITDSDERYRKYQDVAAQMQELQAYAGVNKKIIERGEQVPLSKVLAKESRLQADAPTEFVKESLLKDIRDALQHPSTRLTGQEARKLGTLLKKVRTFDTLRRIIQEAIDREVLTKDWLETVNSKITRAEKNIALKRGIPLVPLEFEPLSAEEFQGQYGTGAVRFEADVPEDQKAHLLGRVGRAISDLEMVYGQGFCGKHAKKLEFQFGRESITARASYFGWDDRNRWQPRVKFGVDYEGLLAHELSHYLEDLLAYRIEKATNPGMPEFQYGDVEHGMGDIFGRTGISVDHYLDMHDRNIDAGMERATIQDAEFPELTEMMRAIQATPDYQRWGNLLSGALEMVLYTAVQNVTGKSMYDEGNEQYENARYKSDLDPAVLAEAERLYVAMMGGDSRKLTYFQSTTEVWARMCEQYVYTRLAKSGITNPWLTQMSYDPEDSAQVMDQETFESVVEPVMDRLFSRLKGRGIMARRSR